MIHLQRIVPLGVVVLLLSSQSALSDLIRLLTIRKVMSACIMPRLHSALQTSKLLWPLPTDITFLSRDKGRTSLFGRPRKTNEMRYVPF